MPQRDLAQQRVLVAAAILTMNDGNITAYAKRIGVARSTLHRWLAGTRQLRGAARKVIVRHATGRPTADDDHRNPTLNAAGS